MFTRGRYAEARRRSELRRRVRSHALAGQVTSATEGKPARKSRLVRAGFASRLASAWRELTARNFRRL